MKKFIPSFYSKNIFEINIDFFLKNNFKYILCDLDNTLDAYFNKKPSEFTKNFVKKIIDSGLDIIIVSNNSKKRVKNYCDGFDAQYKNKIKFVSRALKPYKFKVKKFLLLNNIPLNKCIMVGDQILTDIKFANNLKISSLLTEELENKNQFISLINKKIDKIIRRKLLKRNLLKNWRDIYG